MKQYMIALSKSIGIKVRVASLGHHMVLQGKKVIGIKCWKHSLEEADLYYLSIFSKLLITLIVLRKN